MLETDLITESVRKEIDHWIKKFPPENKRSAVLMALRLVQEQNGGWLSESLMDAVADYLQMPRTAVYEVATFYTMYDLEPCGRHKIGVCTTLSCALNGSDELVSHLEKRLKIKAGETSADGRYTLKKVECLAACGGAPAVLIDDKHYYEKVNSEKIDVILDEIERAEGGT